ALNPANNGAASAGPGTELLSRTANNGTTFDGCRWRMSATCSTTACEMASIAASDSMIDCSAAWAEETGVLCRATACTKLFSDSVKCIWAKGGMVNPDACQSAIKLRTRLSVPRASS